MSIPKPEPTADVNLGFTLSLLPVAKRLQAYHRHEVIGMDSIPSRGRVLLVVNHSLATYDISVLMVAIFEETGRMVRALIDRAFYKVPGLGQLMEMTGARQGSQENANQLLADGNIVAVAPGGMREALKPSSEKYKIFWEKRRGFVKLAIQTQTPIVLAACPAADDLYDVYENPVTKWVYKTFKVPVFFATGWNKTPLPKPVKLTHYLSKPLKPPRPAKTSEALERQVGRFHKKIVAEMHALIDYALAEERRKGHLARPAGPQALLPPAKA